MSDYADPKDLFLMAASIPASLRHPKTSNTSTDWDYCTSLGMLFSSSTRYILMLQANNTLVLTTTFPSPRSSSRPSFSGKVILRTPLRRARTPCQPWKVRIMTVIKIPGRNLTVCFVVEWTFAKQKWQHTKNVVRGDPKFETAQILPGWSEKVYA